MSTKNNALVAVAAAALGLVVTEPRKPIVEGLLNDFSVTALGVAQVDDAGRCIVLASVVDAQSVASIRPVCSVSGDVRAYANIGAVQGLIKRAKLTADAVVTIKRRLKVSTIGDPVNALKSLFVSFKKEKATGEKSVLAVNAKIAAGAALGWDVQVDTPEAAEYADYLVRKESVDELIAYCDNRVTALADSLTAAGIDPLTVV